MVDTEDLKSSGLKSRASSSLVPGKDEFLSIYNLNTYGFNHY